MTRWRQAVDRIGGPDSVTWAAFWVTFVSSVTGNLTTGGQVETSIVMRLGILGVTQLAMFVPLVALRFTLLRNPTRPRPWVAVGGFIVAALVRGVVLGALLLATGASTNALWAYRITSSLLVQGSLLVVVAVVVSTMRAQTRTLEALASVQGELDGVQQQILSEVSSRNDEVLGRVKVRLTDALAELEVTDGVNSVTELQRLATDVVRPMSHELAASLPTSQPIGDSVRQVHVTWRQIISQMSTAVAFRPGMNAMTLAFLMVVATLGTLGLQGVQLTMLIVLTVFVSSWLGNFVLRLALPRVRPGTGIALVVLSALAVGYVSSASAFVVLGGSAFAWTFAIAGGIFVAGMTVLIAVVSAVLRQQAASQADLAERAAQLRRTVVRLRQLQWFQGKALSRALHGPVQAAVTSAALRLDAAVRSGLSADALLPEVRADLRSVVDVLDMDDPMEVDLDRSLNRIVGTWVGLCTVEVVVAEQARELLDADPVLASTVIDLLTEAVSNAVRHGEASRVTVTVTLPDPHLMRVQVQDDGLGWEPGSGAGMGTRLLEECTLEWSLTGHDSGHLLLAVLPA